MNSYSLAEKECAPCKGGVLPLRGEELKKLASQLEGWEVAEEHHLAKSWKFPNFRKALDYVNQVGELAEKVGHHPDLYLAWGKVRAEIWTHKINGLTESDFIFAAKMDKLLTE